MGTVVGVEGDGAGVVAVGVVVAETEGSLSSPGLGPSPKP